MTTLREAVMTMIAAYPDALYVDDIADWDAGNLEDEMEQWIDDEDRLYGDGEGYMYSLGPTGRVPGVYTDKDGYIGDVVYAVKTDEMGNPMRAPEADNQ